MIPSTTHVEASTTPAYFRHPLEVRNAPAVAESPVTGNQSTCPRLSVWRCLKTHIYHLSYFMTRKEPAYLCTCSLFTRYRGPFQKRTLNISVCSCGSNNAAALASLYRERPKPVVSKVTILPEQPPFYELMLQGACEWCWLPALLCSFHNPYCGDVHQVP